MSTDDETAQMLGYNAADVLRWEGVALSHIGDHGIALDSYAQIEQDTIAERIRVELLLNQLHSKLRLQSKDMEECVKLWIDAITGAKALQSEQRFNEAMVLLEAMEYIWPGEARIEELCLHTKHW